MIFAPATDNTASPPRTRTWIGTGRPSPGPGSLGLDTDRRTAASGMADAITWEPAAMKARHAVVTGASGFIGTHLVDELARLGADVTSLDTRPAPAGHGLSQTAADVLEADLADVFAGVDTVFHLAGRPGVRQSWGSGFAAYVRSNVLGTAHVVRACEAAGVRRLVVASSSSVYGPGSGWPSRESDPVRPISPYGVSKLAGEQITLAHALRSGATTSVVALRYFTVYGPDQREDMLIGRLLRAAMTGRAAQVFGDGSQRRDFTYVDDAVRATIAAALVPARAEVVNVAGGRSRSVAEVVALVEEVTGRHVPVEQAPAQDGDVEATCADLTLAGALLGYEPTVSLREGIDRQFAQLTADAGCAVTPASDGTDGMDGMERTEERGC